MKLIVTRLGNTEICVNIRVTIPQALLRACWAVHSLAIQEWERSILAHLPCHRPPYQCDLGWPSVSQAAGLDGLLSSPSLNCPIILQLRFLSCFQYHTCV